MWEKSLVLTIVSILGCHSFSPNLSNGPSPFLQAPPGAPHRPAGFPMMQTMYSEPEPVVHHPKSEPFIPGAIPFYGRPGDTLADIPLNPRPKYNNFDFSPPQDDKTPVLNVALDGENLISLPDAPPPPGLQLGNPEEDGFPSSDKGFKGNVPEAVAFIEHSSGPRNDFSPNAETSIDEGEVDIDYTDDIQGRENEESFIEYGEEEGPAQYHEEKDEDKAENRNENEQEEGREENAATGFEKYKTVDEEHSSRFEDNRPEPRNEPEEFNPYEDSARFESNSPQPRNEPERFNPFRRFSNRNNNEEEDIQIEDRSSDFQGFQSSPFQNQFSEKEEESSFSSRQRKEPIKFHQQQNQYQEAIERKPQPQFYENQQQLHSRPSFEPQQIPKNLESSEQEFGIPPQGPPQRRRPEERRGHETRPSRVNIPQFNERENSLHEFDSLSGVPSRIIGHPKPFNQDSKKRRRPYKQFLDPSSKPYPEDNVLINDLYPDQDYEEDEPDRLSILLQQTRFNCQQKKDGYYADEELGCEVFHFCQDSVRHSWLCPSGASFHQVHLICMPQSDDNICEKSSKFHFVNDYLYKEAPESTGRNRSYVQRYYPKGYEEGIALLEERQAISDNPSLHQNDHETPYLENQFQQLPQSPEEFSSRPRHPPTDQFIRQPQPNIHTERASVEEHSGSRFESPAKRFGEDNLYPQPQDSLQFVGHRSPIQPRRPHDRLQRLGGFRANDDGTGNVRRAQRIHQRLSHNPN